MKRQEEITRKISRDINDPWEMDRREFFRKIGGGLIISFSLGGLPALAGTQGRSEDEVNAYLHIAEDGRVTLFTGKIEMGQGPITSLPMMLADEMDVSLDSVHIIMGDTDLTPYDNGTFGSLTTRQYGQIMRGAAAKARAILLEMAAEELDVPVEDLQVKDGLVAVKSDPGNKITYGDLTKGKKIMRTIDETVDLKQPGEFTYMGTSRKHVDAYAKVTGQAKYSGDIQLPGMMYARMVRPPSLGAKLISIDTSGAEEIEGTEIVRDGDFISVLNPSQDLADVAVAKVSAEFEEEKADVDHNSIYAYITRSVDDSQELASQGNLEEGKKLSDQVFESEYHDPYLAHAPIENHTATAYFEGDKLIMWASCQTPFPTKEDIAEALDIPQDKVLLKEVFVGGGFGGKIYNPQAIEAARLAQLSGKPIQLVYSRQEEFMYDRLRPAAVVKLRSGIDANGRMKFWDYDVYMGGRRGATHFYDIPHHQTTHHFVKRSTQDIHPSYNYNWPHPWYTGAWRGPSNNTNTWARESQVELMAAAAGKDALQFRLDHLEGDPKMAHVLRIGAEKFGWTPAVGPSGRGYGIACGIDAGTWLAVFAEVKVDRSTGQVRVVRAVVSQDMGLVVNPQGAIIQAEGGLIMGLGYALSEEVRFEGRKMLDRNFDTYSLPKISWTPEIEVVFADKQHEPPQGGGEPSVVAIGGAIANAVFDATGARLYRLPLTPERVLAALEAL
ncbi:MAG: molybdopterin-dependent oxidoreductase [Bacteroidales bacterium]|nr:molybdopterin-dependent oxidoreductase [Bacteroidales bacterium]